MIRAAIVPAHNERRIGIASRRVGRGRPSRFDRMAFGPAGRRVWVVGTKPHGCPGRRGNGKSGFLGACPRWFMALVALGSLGVKGWLRHRSLLGAV
eukprot:9480547-Pyramimonas_sp.AAC.1